jgi:mevalonate kinase
LLDTTSLISTFGEDESGDIYFAHLSSPDGAIYQIVQSSNAPSASSSSGGGGGGGCFVATAAYGMQMQPQLKILKALRDKFLLTNLTETDTATE